MSELQNIDQFDGIRRVWDPDGQCWYAVVDVVRVLSESKEPSKYWFDMKRRDESGQLSAICRKFPMKNLNGRTYQTECANEEGILRIVQSIPSAKAEPLKMWLAATGRRRLDEIRNDPLELERERYRGLGYDEEWINARIGSITTRNELTDEWKTRGIQGREYGILTNIVHRGTFDDLTVGAHKKLKGVKKGDLRDHMTPRELAFMILAESSTTENARERNAIGFSDNRQAAEDGGRNAGAARKAFEEASGQKVISNKSYIEERKKLSADNLGKPEE